MQWTRRRSWPYFRKKNPPRRRAGDNLSGMLDEKLARVGKECNRGEAAASLTAAYASDATGASNCRSRTATEFKRPSRCARQRWPTTLATFCSCPGVRRCDKRRPALPPRVRPRSSPPPKPQKIGAVFVSPITVIDSWGQKMATVRKFRVR
jgi:hypothetical protein